MVTKSKDNNSAEQTKRRAKVGKLQLNKETLKNLTASQQRQLRGGLGGQRPPVGTGGDDSNRPTCTCGTCG